MTGRYVAYPAHLIDVGPQGLGSGLDFIEETAFLHLCAHPLRRQPSGFFGLKTTRKVHSGGAKRN